MSNVLTAVFLSELPPEVLVDDAAANLSALSAAALAAALVAALLLAGKIALESIITPWQRRGIVSAWVVCTLIAVVAASPAANWGIPVATAATLPVCFLAGRFVRRRLRDGATNDRSRSGWRISPGTMREREGGA